MFKLNLNFSTVTNKAIKIWSRSSLITNNLIGLKVLVYNGKEFKTIRITREKVGFKFGEFSFTRKIGLKKSFKIISKKKK